MVSRLLKSCANPAANCPTAFSFCASRNFASNCRRSAISAVNRSFAPIDSAADFAPHLQFHALPVPPGSCCNRSKACKRATNSRFSIGRTMYASAPASNPATWCPDVVWYPE